MRVAAILAVAAACLSTVHAIPVEIESLDIRADLEPRFIATNDFSCKSDKNPVIMLHGLFVNRNLDLNFLEKWLRPQGYCTYGLTYGEYREFPIVGGLKPVAESSQEIVDLINEVLEKTGAKKVDLVGHSEGGLQALYVAKVRKMSDKIDKIVGIAPVTHGTDLSNLLDIANLLGIRPLVDDVLDAVGCAFCTGISPGGDAVRELNDGPIVQPGNKVTIIASKYDTVVTPAGTASFVDEPGVFNVYTQDVCPLDVAGHVSLAIDRNMFLLTRNALQGENGKKFRCRVFSGVPVKN
ncbi:alpha/beta hydrolase fold-1 [Akanthomyces lecanii RCEF 1005]|uniref:Alpha/beta hydrolase fold-1 n=1 Tax=Akanthomyces lecanii RCEF 1005 TaxID=1081108 RepID=A0A162MT97_CORDF|nr:alpha/beta hydrolase fold-1 [Akanthomyces lecanii RCEF 1005]